MYSNFINTVVFIYTVKGLYKGKLINSWEDYVELKFPNNETIYISKQHIISISNSVITGC